LNKSDAHTAKGRHSAINIAVLIMCAHYYSDFEVLEATNAMKANHVASFAELGKARNVQDKNQR